MKNVTESTLTRTGTDSGQPRKSSVCCRSLNSRVYHFVENHHIVSYRIARYRDIVLRFFHHDISLYIVSNIARYFLLYFDTIWGYYPEKKHVNSNVVLKSQSNDLQHCTHYHAACYLRSTERGGARQVDTIAGTGGHKEAFPQPAY